MKRNLHAGKLQSGGFSLNMFTDEELYDIHLTTLEVLEKTGVFVENEEALEVLYGGGAVIDKKKKIAKLPSYLVEDSLSSAPPKFVMGGRRPEDDFVVENNRVGFTNFGEGILTADLETGKLREPTKKDVADSAKIGDFLSEVSVYNRYDGQCHYHGHGRCLIIDSPGGNPGGPQRGTACIGGFKPANLQGRSHYVWQFHDLHGP